MKLIMNWKALFMATVLLSFTKFVNAQSAGNEPAQQQVALARPFYIIDQLAPVTLAAAAQNPAARHTDIYSFDMIKTRQLFPQLIRTENIWVQKGKNNLRAENKEVIDLAQLVPVLVAALQQQREELVNLKAEIAKLQGQLNNNTQAR